MSQTKPLPKTIVTLPILWLLFDNLFLTKTCCVSGQLHKLNSLQPQPHLLFQIGSLVDWRLSQYHLNSASVKFSVSNSELDRWISYVGERQPIIAGNVNTRPIGNPVISIVSLPASALSHVAPNYITDWIKLYNNRRSDHFIFVGDKSTLLQLWEERAINRLYGKWGYTIDTNEFLHSIELDPVLPYFKTLISQFDVSRNVVGRNIRRRHFRFSSWPYVPPYLFITSIKPDGEKVVDGTHIRIFSESMAYFNFTFELHLSNDNSYGRLLTNGTWTGMIGDVADESKNFDSCLYIAPSPAWLSLMEFVGPLSETGVNFLTVRPIAEIQWQAFLYPFKATLWVTMGFLYSGVVLLMFIFKELSSASETTLQKSESFIGVAMMVFQIALEQNAKVPSGIKLLAGLWLFLTIISGNAYKSQVFSSLTLPFSDKLPETYEELAIDTEYTTLLNNVGGLEVEYFEKADSPYIRQIAKDLKYIANPIECVSEAVLNPKTVCIAWVPFLTYYFAQSVYPDAVISPLYVSPDAVLSTVSCVAFSKFSPFADGFAPIISTFWESGIYKMWAKEVLHINVKKGFEKYNENPNTPLHKKLRQVVEDLIGTNSGKPLKISNLKMMFAILFAGLILGLLLFLVEFPISKFRKTSKTKSIILIQSRRVAVRSLVQA